MTTVTDMSKVWGSSSHYPNVEDSPLRRTTHHDRRTLTRASLIAIHFYFLIFGVVRCIQQIGILFEVLDALLIILLSICTLILVVRHTYSFAFAVVILIDCVIFILSTINLVDSLVRGGDPSEGTFRISHPIVRSILFALGYVLWGLNICLLIGYAKALARKG